MEEKKEISIKTYGKEISKIPLCPHISILGSRLNENDYPEYTEDVAVFCHICNRDFSFEIRIN